ncbi:MAG TPA: PEGA domain-containing protein, partial [Pyrinomonadaceae bacterium]
MSKTRFFAKYFRLAFAGLLGLAFIAAQPSTTVHAKPKKAKYGTIKILTAPAGLPLSIDGKSYGETTRDYRGIDLDPGLHSVVVTLPNGQRWSREIDLPAGRI